MFVAPSLGCSLLLRTQKFKSGCRLVYGAVADDSEGHAAMNTADRLVSWRVHNDADEIKFPSVLLFVHVDSKIDPLPFSERVGHVESQGDESPNIRLVLNGSEELEEVAKTDLVRTVRQEAFYDSPSCVLNF